MVKRSIGHNLKVLRSDNGGKYTSREFAEYLLSEVICHQLKDPESPQQNGDRVAECFNLHNSGDDIVDFGREWLPQKLWAEKLSFAVFLRIWISTKAVERITSFEAFYGKKFGIFQCLGVCVLPILPKMDRRS